MQSTTHTRINIPSQPSPGETHRIATVSGTQEGCERARQMIQQISAEQGSAGVMAGAPFSGGVRGPQRQQPYGGPQENQQAYSAEWAAYHAAQAAAQQQQQLQQAAQALAAVTPTATGQQQPAPDTYYEQFFRYAYYYGEEAARKYYDAWSPPAGTPNPYGINPAGIQPAPAAEAHAQPPAAQPQQSSAAPMQAHTQPAAHVGSEARETGRRKVSNLPAWMTKG